MYLSESTASPPPQDAEFFFPYAYLLEDYCFIGLGYLSQIIQQAFGAGNDMSSSMKSKDRTIFSSSSNFIPKYVDGDDNDDCSNYHFLNLCVIGIL